MTEKCGRPSGDAYDNKMSSAVDLQYHVLVSPVFHDEKTETGGSFTELNRPSAQPWYGETANCCFFRSTWNWWKGINE